MTAQTINKPDEELLHVLDGHETKGVKVSPETSYDLRSPKLFIF